MSRSALELELKRGSEQRMAGSDRRASDFTPVSPRMNRFNVEVINNEVKQLIKGFQTSNDEIDSMIESLK